MDEKPGFWQFFKSKWRGRHSDRYIYITGKKNEVLSIYSKPNLYVIISTIFYFLYLSIPPISFLVVRVIYHSWENMYCDNMYLDVVIACYASLLLLEILLAIAVHTFMKFKKLPEDEWEKTDYKDIIIKSKKVTNAIFKSFLTILLIFFFLNSYSFGYLRYLAGGESAKMGMAQVFVDTPRYITVKEDQTDETFKVNTVEGTSDVDFKIETAWILNKVYIYVNGTNISGYYINEGGWFFWQSRYFVRQIYLNLDSAILHKSNTLEVKSDNFDKVWTFTVEQG